MSQFKMITKTRLQDISKFSKNKNFHNLLILFILLLSLAVINGCDSSDDKKVWYKDADNDGYGDPNISVNSKSQPEGYLLNNTDCDDTDKDIFPAAVEIADDNIDQNCDGVDLKTWYRDADGDGFGDHDEILFDDIQPDGYVNNDSDCNDDDPDVNNCESGIYEGDISIKSDSDIDKLKNYSSITGTLSITGASSLKGLECLSGIGKDFELGTYHWYKGLYFNGNRELKNLEGIKNLTSIGGSLSITGNDSLTDLKGLDNLISTGSDLKIYKNTSLRSLIGLQGLKSINGDIIIGIYDWAGDPGFESLDIIGNDSLLNLSGLENITKIDGNLEIRGNKSLEHLEGLKNLDSIQGNLIISANDSLMTVHSLINLTHINGDIYIGESTSNYVMDQQFYYTLGNNSLISINGLNRLATIGGDLIIQHNDSLIDITGFKQLYLIGGSLSIYNNKSFTNLDFPGLKNIGSLVISNNKIFDNNIAENLRNRIIVGDDNNGTVIIEENLDPSYSGKIWNGDYIIRNEEYIDTISDYNYISRSLKILSTNFTNLHGLESLDRIGEDFVIENNSDLISLEGVENITEIHGAVWISNNNALLNMEGLNNLAYASSLIIYNNDDLMNLQGLNSLTSVDCLRIYDNDVLANLEGLNSLTSVKKEILIYQNDSLCQNMVTTFIMNLKERPDEWQIHITPNKDCSIP